MSNSSRFVVSVHIATAICMKDGDPISSEAVANSVGTNPSLVRKLLASMGKAGITTSRLGTGGGAVLARPAGEINLGEIYQAVEDRDLFATHATPPNQDCMVGRNILPVLAPSLQKARDTMIDELSRVSLQDVAGAVRERAKIHGGSILF